MNEQKQAFRTIPSVYECIKYLKSCPQTGTIPDSRLKYSAQRYLQQLREHIRDGKIGLPLNRGGILAQLGNYTLQYHEFHFSRVINATGVIIHTNMGRSPLAREAIDHIIGVGGFYNNLEFDLDSGKRGSRYSHVEDILCELTGAESCLVVNNNAAAVFIALETLAKNGEAIVSRGQLVEIGGSFRIPDIMMRSGARMVEVGTTNRTHIRDYVDAITGETALLLRVHCSNYRVIGFTSEVARSELVRIGQEHAVPVMEDLGSGCLVDLSEYGLRDEPTVQEVLATGVDLVTFSGDKLLGGPQAGILAGKRQYIEMIKQNPLNRALRIDKFTLAALESTLRLYLDPEVVFARIPTLAMISTSLEVVTTRAQRLYDLIAGWWRPSLGDCTLFAVTARVGGGALPEQDLPSMAIAIRPLSVKLALLEQRLRREKPAIVARVEHDQLLLDARTIIDDELETIAAALFRSIQ